MNIFGVGLPEIAVISALALIIFGPKRLPELGRSLGKTLKGLQTASTEFEKEIQKAMTDNEGLDEDEKKKISVDLIDESQNNDSSKPIES
tara:strand:+ start:425 stop:694 length:270 start_codon:yes stop_codon:yes gene_type:complete